MELLLVAAFVTVLLACCGLTHCFIEAPMQRLGRRVAARLDARFGPDTPDTPDREVPPRSLTAGPAVSGTPHAAGAGPR